MLRYVYLLTIVSFVTVSTGCAQVVRGSSAVVTVQSNPPGAYVQASTGMTCNSPCALVIPRRASAAMTISMDGYQPVSVQFVSEFNVGWFLIDLLITNVFVIVSMIGGALYDVTPDSVFVTMQPLASRPDLQPKVVRLSCENKGEKASCSVDEVDAIPADARRARARAL